jgi:hypothetical protein
LAASFAFFKKNNIVGLIDEEEKLKNEKLKKKRKRED